jgi:hypothetical protein
VTQRITLKLHYDISQLAVICTRCGFALKNGGNHVGRHLGETHSILKLERRNINKFIQSLRLADPTLLFLIVVYPKWSPTRVHSQVLGYLRPNSMHRFS